MDEKKKEELDIDKARKIVLEEIGEEEKEKINIKVAPGAGEGGKEKIWKSIDKFSPEKNASSGQKEYEKKIDIREKLSDYAMKDEAEENKAGPAKEALPKKIEIKTEPETIYHKKIKEKEPAETQETPPRALTKTLAPRAQGVQGAAVKKGEKKEIKEIPKKQDEISAHHFAAIVHKERKNIDFSGFKKVFVILLNNAASLAFRAKKILSKIKSKIKPDKDAKKHNIKPRKVAHDFKKDLILLKYFPKYFLKYSGYALVLVFAGYFIFAIIIYNANLDSYALSKIAGFMRLPAIITRMGIIDYAQYKEFLEKNNYNPLAAKTESINSLLVKKLAKDYNIDLMAPNSIDSLKKIVVFDGKINGANIDKIEAIRRFVKSGGSFDEALVNGDEFSFLKYYNYEDAREKFGLDFKKINVSASKIIINPEGYYLLDVIGKTAFGIDLKYAFIKAKTLENYLDQEKAYLKVVSFVD